MHFLLNHDILGTAALIHYPQTPTLEGICGCLINTNGNKAQKTHSPHLLYVSAASAAQRASGRWHNTHRSTQSLRCKTTPGVAPLPGSHFHRLLQYRVSAFAGQAVGIALLVSLTSLSPENPFSLKSPYSCHFIRNHLAAER